MQTVCLFSSGAFYTTEPVFYNRLLRKKMFVHINIFLALNDLIIQTLLLLTIPMQHIFGYAVEQLIVTSAVLHIGRGVQCSMHLVKLSMSRYNHNISYHLVVSW